MSDTPHLPATTLAEIRNDALNQTRLSETGTAYWGSNWREVRKLYTADHVRSAVAEAVQRTIEDCARICEARHMGDNNREDMEARRCAAAIRAKAGAPTPEGKTE